jgi:hypothetical protein
MKLSAGGFFWYRNSEDYERIRSLSEDADSFFASYSLWLQAATNGFEEMGRTVQVIKVEVDIDDYLSWCNASGRSVNSKSRVAYANAKVFESLRSD